MKSLLICLLLSSLFVSAQYDNLTLMDQLRLELEERDAVEENLRAGKEADLSQVDGEDKISFLNRAIVSIELERYNSFSGVPFYFDYFGPAVLRDLANEAYPLSSINYNAYSGRIEYRQGENWVLFLPNFFPRVDYGSRETGYRTLVYGFISDYPDKYAEFIYSGVGCKAAIHRKVFTFENKTYDASPVATRFAPKDFLYVMVNGKWKQSSFKISALAKDLGFKNEIVEFAKREKLITGNREDLKEILRFADALHKRK